LLVTWNGKDFECGFSRKHAIKIVDPDHYLRALFEELPGEVLATITRLAARKRRPPMTPVELVDALPAERGAAVDGVSAVGQDGKPPQTPSVGPGDGTLAESILVRHACRQAREGHVR
jgi:hypothetical protein